MYQMLSKKLARNLLPFVNDQRDYELLQEYVAERVDLIVKQLENVGDMREMSLLQGQLKELRRFKTLREEAIQDSKDK